MTSRGPWRLVQRLPEDELGPEQVDIYRTMLGREEHWAMLPVRDLVELMQAIGRYMGGRKARGGG